MRQVFNGQVFLADGTTPAWGAQVLYFEPCDNEPKLARSTDALGNLKPRSTWWMNIPAIPGELQGPLEPVVVALLPGACGATVVPPPERSDIPLRVVLPPAISQRGHVKVGGQAPSRLNGTIRVKAGYQDRGFLNELLSVSATADVDGNFTLAGLTPGKYLIQAALDDIWLSPSTAVHVTDSEPKPIELNIPAPGAPVVVKMVDAKGQPRIGETLTIDRTTGPLEETLWPREWTSDGVGVVTIPTLEAGKHVLRAINATSPLTVTVPALPAKGAVEAKMLLKDPLPGAKTTPLYKPRETLPEIPDRPADDPLRGKNEDIQATVLSKIPSGTKYYRVRQISEREAWTDIDYRPEFGSRMVGTDITMKLGDYKENGSTITVIAVFGMDRKGDGEYLSTVRIEKAIDLKSQ